MPLVSGDNDLGIPPPRSLDPRLGTALLLALLVSVLLLEWTSGEAFSLYLFYVFPIALAAWNFGLRVGFAIAGLSAAYCIAVALSMRAPGAPATHLLWQSATTLTLFALIAYAVAYHRRFVDSAVAHARTDHETGALSRREFERLLDSESRRAKRYERPLSLALVDAGAIKDAEVPAKGFLASIADALRRQVREGDPVARIGARRFAVMLIECHPAEANHVMRRTCEALAQRFQRPLAFRFGAVSYGGSGHTSALELLQAAERELNAPRAGANGAAPEAVIV